MVLCGLGMQQYAMHNATIQKTTYFEFGLYYMYMYNHDNKKNGEKKLSKLTSIWKNLSFYFVC